MSDTVVPTETNQIPAAYPDAKCVRARTPHSRDSRPRRTSLAGLAFCMESRTSAKARRCGDEGSKAMDGFTVKPINEMEAVNDGITKLAGRSEG